MTQENRFSWVKPGLWGAVVGAAALAVVGFTWGDWATSGTAERMATARADKAVVTLLTPICAAQARADPESSAKLTELAAMPSYNQSKYITEAKWADIAGVELSTSVQRDLLSACRDELLKVKPA